MFKSKERYYTPPPPHPPPPPTNTTPKKTTKKDKKRGFAEAKHNKKGKNALSLWRQCSEHAKTLFRDAAFCARPANYTYTVHIHTPLCIEYIYIYYIWVWITSVCLNIGLPTCLGSTPWTCRKLPCDLGHGGFGYPSIKNSL